MSFADATIERLPGPLRPFAERHHELIKFAIVGATTFVIDMAVFFTLKLTILEPKPVTAKIIAGIVAVIASYILNREWSFRDRGGRERHHEALLFFVVSGVGVVLAMVPLWMLANAIGCGNTFVLKPSEKDPSASLALARWFTEAGLPDGVLNVLQGDREAVDRLLEHPDVRAISFVGSTPVARSVYARATAAGKRVQALGGAKNYMIVLPDADMDVALKACSGSIFGSTGQRCLAGSVIVGVGDAHAQIRDRMLDSAASIRLGDGLQPGTDMGPLISAAHRDRVNAFIDQGVSDGAKLSLDGRGATVEGLEGGYWVGATVFADVPPDVSIATEEVFGPVAGINRAKDIDEAIRMMHASRYGNACSIFTTSGKAAREFRYQAGISMIGVNIGVAAPMAFFPFGGSKGSFYGDLKAQGRDGIFFYTDQRVVISRW